MKAYGAVKDLPSPRARGGPISQTRTCLLEKQEVLGRSNRLLFLYDTGHIENDASNNSSIVASVFVTTVTFLQSRCLATVGRFLPSLCLATIGWYTYRHTDWWEGFFLIKQLSLAQVPWYLYQVGFEVFTAVVLKSIIFWNMTPCSP
jgi:hypothetical protein